MPVPIIYRIQISAKTSHARLTRFRQTRRPHPVIISLERLPLYHQTPLAAVLASAILTDHLVHLGTPAHHRLHHPASSALTRLIAVRISLQRHITITTTELNTLMLTHFLSPSTPPSPRK